MVATHRMHGCSRRVRGCISPDESVYLSGCNFCSRSATDLQPVSYKLVAARLQECTCAATGFVRFGTCAGGGGVGGVCSEEFEQGVDVGFARGPAGWRSARCRCRRRRGTRCRRWRVRRASRAGSGGGRAAVGWSASW